MRTNTEHQRDRFAASLTFAGLSEARSRSTYPSPSCPSSRRSSSVRSSEQCARSRFASPRRKPIVARLSACRSGHLSCRHCRGSGAHQRGEYPTASRSCLTSTQRNATSGRLIAPTIPALRAGSSASGVGRRVASPSGTVQLCKSGMAGNSGRGPGLARFRRIVVPADGRLARPLAEGSPLLETQPVALLRLRNAPRPRTASQTA